MPLSIASSLSFEIALPSCRRSLLLNLCHLPTQLQAARTPPAATSTLPTQLRHQQQPWGKARVMMAMQPQRAKPINSTTTGHCPSTTSHYLPITTMGQCPSTYKGGARWQWPTTTMSRRWNDMTHWQWADNNNINRKTPTATMTMGDRDDSSDGSGGPCCN
ncbi:hypothetical protein EDB89DRAFT_1912295 [Lactarius sanguifluus]|nr:hypothetical protein EDB89DRAFT_1912295 [Lactarius sanguifluus]